MSKKSCLDTSDLDKIYVRPSADPTDVQENIKDYVSPPKISGHLKRIIKQKVIVTMPKPFETKNRFQVLTESEEEDEQILKKHLQAKKKKEIERDLKIRKNPQQISQLRNLQKITKKTKKSSILPIVFDRVLDDHKGLTGRLREIIKGNVNLKYTNNSTIVFTDDKVECDNVMESIKNYEMAFHTEKIS